LTTNRLLGIVSDNFFPFKSLYHLAYRIAVWEGKVQFNPEMIPTEQVYFIKLFKDQ